MKRFISPQQSDNIGYCQLCGREKPLSFHHLISRTLHSNKWFRKQYTKKEMQTRGMDLCKDCHKYLHWNYTEKELGREFNTKEALLENEDLQKFLRYIRKQR